MKCSRLGVALAVWCVTLAAASLAMPAQAQQFVLVDVEYTATSQNTMDSHYRVKPMAGIPSNWVSPVNYSMGKVYVELQVEEKPGNKATWYNICIENASNPACLPYVKYSTTGKYSANFQFGPDVWQWNMVDWTMGCTQVSLILKDDTETKQQGNADFYPYKAHVVLTILAPGGTYVPPSMGGSAGSPAAGSGSGGKGGSGGMSASSGGKGGFGGMTASSGGKGGSGGMSSSTSSGGKGGSSAMSASSGGKGGSASDAGVTTTQDAGAGSGGKSASSTSGGSAANSGNGSAGTLSNQVKNDQSVSSQLESTGGCSTSGRNASGAGWFLLGLGLLARRRRG